MIGEIIALLLFLFVIAVLSWFVLLPMTVVFSVGASTPTNIGLFAVALFLPVCLLIVFGFVLLLKSRE